MSSAGSPELGRNGTSLPSSSHISVAPFASVASLRSTRLQGSRGSRLHHMRHRSLNPLSSASPLLGASALKSHSTPPPGPPPPSWSSRPSWFCPPPPNRRSGPEAEESSLSPLPPRCFALNLDSAIVRAPRASSQVLRQGGERISAQAYLRYGEYEIREADAA